MAAIGNWIVQNTETIGKGPIVLSEPLEGFTSFQQAIPAGEVWYSIKDGLNREAGIGTYNGVDTIERTTVHATLMDGHYEDENPVLIDLSGDIAEVACTFNAKAFNTILEDLSQAVKWRGNWVAQDYVAGDMVYASPWTLIANTDAGSSDTPPKPQGIARPVFNGELITQIENTDQIIFGIRIAADYALRRLFNLQVFMHDTMGYEIYFVENPTTTPIRTALVDYYQATVTGWQTINLGRQVLETGTIYDIEVLMMYPEGEGGNTDLPYEVDVGYYDDYVESGLLSLSRVTPILETDDAYGINFFAQRYGTAPEWDIVATSGEIIPPSPPNAVLWGGNWEQKTYPAYTQVVDAPWTMISNKITSDRAGVQPVGNEYYVYDGTITPFNTSAKYVYFGNRYSVQTNGLLTGYRIYTTTDVSYVVNVVRNSDSSSPIITELRRFTASSTGWLELAINAVLVQAGTTFDLVIQSSEPNPTPTSFSGDWTYTTPNNDGYPDPGEVLQSNKNPSLIKVNYVDANGGDWLTELNGLSIGDTIESSGAIWTIQSLTPSDAYITFSVTPTVQTSPNGLLEFIFYTSVANNIPVGRELNYWDDKGNAQGLFIADGSYFDIVPDGNAYGCDIQVQQVSKSEDWDVVSVSGDIS